MKMNSMIAMAILAWCEAVDAAALPQAPGIVVPAVAAATKIATSAPAGSATANAAATPGLTITKPILPGLPVPAVPGVPSAGLPVVQGTTGVPSLGFPFFPGAPTLPGAPALPGVPAPGLVLPPVPPVVAPPVPLSIPNLASALPKLPVVDGLPPIALPTGPPALPPITLPDLSLSPVPKVPGPGDVPKGPSVPSVPLPSDPDTVESYVKVGKIVLSNILNLLWKGAQAAKIPGLDLNTVPVPAVPVVNTTVPSAAVPLLKKRQAVASSVPAAVASPAAGGLLGGLTGTLGGVTGGLPIVGGLTGGLTGGSSPLGAVTGTVGGVTGSLPAVGGVTGALTGGSNPLGAVTGTVGGVTGGLTGGSSPIGAVTGTVGGLTGGLTGGSGPLGAVTGAVGGAAGTVGSTVGSLPVVGGAVAPVAGAVGSALGTVGGVAGSLPVVGGAVQGAVNTVGGAVNSVLPGPYPINQGVPGSDPVGGLSISIIATLLSLLKKDPLSLFGGLGATGGLLKRDLPELHARHQIEKRQLAGLPSLSSGLPGVGIGALPLSGVPGVSPDIAFLVGSIAKNIAVPGGKGLGSVTGNILSVLNGVVPNFLFKLPVVQDSVPTFGALQLLASINPTKFGALSDLTNLAALSNAASSISANDLAFIRGLPITPDPSNLITTITTLTDNILSLPGNVVNLKAAVSVLCLKNLGLAVAGL